MTQSVRIIRKASHAFAVLIALTAAANAAGLESRISAAKVAEGDSFQLMLSGDATTLTAAPDLSPLGADFDVLGNAQSRQTQIINGARSDTVQWTVTLSPKSRGVLTIPTIQAGAASSDPLGVEVVDAASPLLVRSPDMPEIEVTLPEGTHYVYQELPLTLRITSGPNLQSGQIVLPQSPDFLLSQSGEDRISQDIVNGAPVRVFERTYMLRPQVSGPLTVPPIALKAVVSDPNTRSPFAGSPFESMLGSSPFRGFAGFGGLMNSGKEITVRTPALTVEIKADPTGAATWFLPAKDLQISATWDPVSPTFKVGEAVTRIVQVLALGATNVQVPDLNIPAADGLRIYLDETDARTVDTPQGTAALREFRYSIVPVMGGELTIPEVQLNWFNSVTETQETAILAAEVVSVAGGVAAVIDTPSPATSNDNSGQTDAFLWPQLAHTNLILLLIVGLASVWFWRRRAALGRNRRDAMSVPDQRRKALRAANDAARKADLSALYASAQTWRRLIPDDAHGGFNQRFPDLFKEWLALEASVYAPERHGIQRFDVKAFVRSLNAADLKFSRAGSRIKRKSALGPLYKEAA